MPDKQPTTPVPRPLVGLFAGVAAGLAASAAMALFQAKAAPLFGADEGKGDPATVKAADAVATGVKGSPLPKEWRPPAGQLVHYAVGAGLGGLYGLITEYRPGASAGFGSAYGVVTSALLDEGAVPAVGLGGKPWETPLGVHGYGLASHLVYGTVLEGARALLGGRRLAHSRHKGKRMQK